MSVCLSVSPPFCLSLSLFIFILFSQLLLPAKAKLSLILLTVPSPSFIPSPIWSLSAPPLLPHSSNPLLSASPLPPHYSFIRLLWCSLATVVLISFVSLCKIICVRCVLLWREGDTRHFSMPTIDTKEGLPLKRTGLFMCMWNSGKDCVVHSLDIKASGFLFYHMWVLYFKHFDSSTEFLANGCGCAA